MLRPRIIPSLLVSDNGLVKTVKFKDPKYVGDPINAVKIFNEKEADELIVTDIDATTKRIEPNYRLISQFAVESRMPLCYGGGIKTVEQARRIISLGIEKISLSSAAIEEPALITDIAAEVGRQSVVVVIDCKKKLLGGYDVVTHNGTKGAKRSPVEFATDAVRRGAGELVINSIDNDGTMKGYDLTLAKELRAAVNIPITFLGGAGSLDDIRSLLSVTGTVGAAAGSLFVFKGAYRAVLINYPTREQRDDVIRATRLASTGR